MGVKKLTLKQESFCNEYIKNGGNASDAYRHAYNASKMKYNTINSKAYLLLAMDYVTARVNVLKERLAKRNEVTVDSLLAELEEARVQAKGLDHTNVMVSASMGKAKITGLEKQVIDMKVTPISFLMDFGASEITPDDDVNDYD